MINPIIAIEFYNNKLDLKSLYGYLIIQMITEKLIVKADGHIHLYPQYNLQTAFDSMFVNLQKLSTASLLMAPDVSGTKENKIFKMAFLVEKSGLNFFQELIDESINVSNIGYEIAGSADQLSCLLKRRSDGESVCLVPGRQIVTREKIEVLGLILREKIPDNLPVDEVIQEITSHAGVPVLSWAPGKWFFERGKVIERIIENSQPVSLLIGDTSLRPTLWPMPRLMRRAKERGFIIIPGSDPLPFSGEEQFLGTCGFIYKGAFDTAYPASSFRKVVESNQGNLLPAGRRRSFGRVIRCLLKNMYSRKKKAQ